MPFFVRNKKELSPLVWTFTTYFAEGFPYTIFRTISSVFFRDRGASLEAIGLTSLFGLPWVLKFLWAPFLDEFGTKRKWMLTMQSMLAALILITAGFAPLQNSIPVIATIFFIGSFAAATHDVAIDGFYMHGLDHEGQAKFVGYRVMAYRISMMTGTGVIVTIGTTLGWPAAFTAAGICMAGLSLIHYAYLPQPESENKALLASISNFSKVRILLYSAALATAIVLLRAFLNSQTYVKLQTTFPILQKFTFPAWIGLFLFITLTVGAASRNRLKKWLLHNPDAFYSKAFVSFMEHERIGAIIFFIILIRTGEFMLSAMAAPFMIDLGIKVHYGWISGGVGLPCSIGGAMLGGWMISRYGLKKMTWPFLFCQNVTNLIYMALAFGLQGYVAANTGNPEPLSIGGLNLGIIVLVHGFDQFAGGLGTAILMTYLMRLCRPAHKAAHYAIGTGLMSVSGLYAGVLSGFLASWFGYPIFFGLSFAFSLPGMIMIFFVPFPTASEETQE